MSLEALWDEVPPDLRGERLHAAYRLAWQVAGTRPAGRREPGYRFHHGHRVARLARALWEQPDVAAARQAEGTPAAVAGIPVEELVWAGALLHDVAKDDAAADEGGDHAARGRDVVVRALAGTYPPDALALLAAIVFRHNKRGAPGDPVPVRVVQDADLLDHFGITEIWLGAYWSAAAGQGLADYLAFVDGERGRAWWRYAADHVHFPSARRELEARMRLAREAIAHLRREARGELLTLTDGGG